ncbi:MAG: hypothetical protein M3O36_11355, partial [Myxococcota bacterium]|nr:hypothetical protein [Myxococcota bacterium]
FCTMDEYAARLQVCRRTVGTWIQAGMPSFRAGGLRRIQIAKADAWIESGGADLVRARSRAKRPALLPGE